MKENFLKITNVNELAQFFGFSSYTELSKIVYDLNKAYKYVEFKIPKKNGNVRIIKSPCKKLKKIQGILKDVLYEVYLPKPSVHGFVKNKSIVSNVTSHLDKKFIFNLDLSDYFGSIHFGRVRNLFEAYPCNFNRTISTILAHICCDNDVLPQGAPTSPIIANMISFKLDRELQYLAKKKNSTYTRYADDITFSFTCLKQQLPKEILKINANEVVVGDSLREKIEKNGFKINTNKVRLNGNTSRMEVTGLTINKFPNVQRKYIRQISSILYAWKKFGYEAAEIEFNQKYNHKHRPSKKIKSLLYVVKGKLAFLSNVRGKQDTIFIKLATRFNELVDDNNKFRITGETNPKQNAVESLWILEANDEMTSQGTGFQLDQVGIITAAHVIANKEKKIPEAEEYYEMKAFKITDKNKKYDLTINHVDRHRDIAICSIKADEQTIFPVIKISENDIKLGEEVTLLGFPIYHSAHRSHYEAQTKVTRNYVKSSVDYFEIETQIRSGNSGGPIINKQGELVGIALEGVYGKESGKNGCLKVSELQKIIKEMKESFIIHNDLINTKY